MRPGPHRAKNRRLVRLVLFITVSTSGIRVGVSTPTLTRHEHAHHAPHCSSNRHSCASKNKRCTVMHSTVRRIRAAREGQFRAAFRASTYMHAHRRPSRSSSPPSAAAVATRGSNLSSKARRDRSEGWSGGWDRGRQGGAHRNREVVGGAHAGREGRPPWVPAGGWGLESEEVVTPPPRRAKADVEQDRSS